MHKLGLQAHYQWQKGLTAYLGRLYSQVAQSTKSHTIVVGILIGSVVSVVADVYPEALSFCVMFWKYINPFVVWQYVRGGDLYTVCQDEFVIQTDLNREVLTSRL